MSNNSTCPGFGSLIVMAILAAWPIGLHGQPPAGAKLKPDLPPELALVPPESFAFLHVRVADVWDSEPAVKLRKIYAKHVPTNLFGLDVADVESVTYVAATLQSPADFLFPHRKMSGKAESKKAVAPQPPEDSEPKDDFDAKKKKKDHSGKEPDRGPEKTKEKDAVPPGQTAGSQARDGGPPAGPEMLFIVTMKAPVEQAKIVEQFLGKDSTEEKHAGKSYFTNPRVSVSFAGDRTFVLATRVALITKVLDRPAKARAEGPLAPALELAGGKHQLVLGLNLTEATCVQARKQVEAELKNPRAHVNEPVWALTPLLETRSAALAADFGRENKVTVQASLTYADAEHAANAVDAVRDGLTLGRVFTLGQARQALQREIEEAEDPLDLLFVSLAIKEAETALRAAKVQRRQATVQVRVEGEFDVDYLRGKAKIAMTNFVPDEAARTAKLRRQSTNNLKQIMLAMFNFHDTYGEFPPAAICSKKDGKPLLSWRVAILPFIEQQPLYAKFKLDEPWDSPHNIKLLPLMPAVYAPPGNFKTKEPFTTFFQALVGPGAAFEIMPDKKSPLGARGFRIAAFTDGTSNTIGIAEAFEPVPWTKPADLAYDAKKPLPKFGGVSREGFLAGIVDGSVRFISNKMSEKTLRAAITKDGGEVLGSDW